MPAIRHRAAAAVAASQTSVDPIREFAFSDTDFQTLTRLAYEYAGISLAESKQNLIYSRLSRRLRALRLESFRHYCEYLTANASEVENFINSISTNHTKFFREAHHFDHFRTHVAAPFAQGAARKSGQRLRIWSAGCSSGEEPYTIAVVLRREIRDFASHNVRILATDIDTDILTKAAQGEFAAAAMDESPSQYHPCFQPMNEGTAAKVTVDEDVQSLIVFRRLNLMEDWPFQGLFDAIFCRNVMIYFDTPTKMHLVDRFKKQLKPGGWLYIGHSESLVGSHPGLELVGRTTYRRIQ
ncbi:MAG: protein-glutamate O-methyltransferase CheR [Xanthobacteraceae bacterium]